MIMTTKIMTMMMKTTMTMMMAILSVSNCPAGIHQCCTSYDLQPFITKSTYMFICCLRVWLLSNFRVYFYFFYFKKFSFITFSWLFIFTICTFISCGTFLLSQTKYCKKSICFKTTIYWWASSILNIPEAQQTQAFDP